MNNLIFNYEKLCDFYENSKEYYTHYSKLSTIPVSENTISIVMTSSNRLNQTLFTLKRISESKIKDIQVILVDDSSIEPVLLDHIKDFPFTIDLISIIREKKFWVNPCINYNIGFSFIKGGLVIIQNAEVCHICDVLEWVYTNVKDNNYYVFDVKASAGFTENSYIHNFENTLLVYDKPWYGSPDLWYQHTVKHARNYHFLTAMTSSTFNRIQGFSYDYSFGVAFDDNDLVLKILSLDISIRPVGHSEIGCGGIHQYHELTEKTWGKENENNDKLWNMKQFVYSKHKIYYEICDFKNSTNKLVIKERLLKFLYILAK